MKKITIFLFLFVSTLANAQSFTLSGKVVDENNDFLPGATILVKESKKGTSTDFDGQFSVNLSKGKYTIQVSFIGYKSVSKEVSLTKNDEIEFSLLPDSTVLEEVLVSAVRVKANSPVTHSNLSKKEIAKRNLGQDIPILLNYLPSVTTSSDAGAGVGYTYIRVRGSDGSRVNVTVNGIPYNDAESQGSFWVNMGDFASSTESLQLQRGVGTSTNGSGAFGASLNILTDAISEEAGGEISNSFGSYGTRKHTAKFTTGKVNDHFEFAGRLSNVYSDGYIDRAFTDLKSYFLQASYVDENTLVKALAFSGKEYTYQAWFGLTAEELKEDRKQNPYTYDNETDNYQQDHYQLHWNEKLNKNWSTNLGLNYTRGKGYFEQFKGEESAADFNNLIEEDSDVIVRRWLDNHFYVANFNATYKNDEIEIIGGMSYSNYTNDHYGEVIWGSDLSDGTTIRDQYYFSDAKKTDYSSFVKTTYKVTDQLTAFVDLQGRFVTYKTKGLTSDRDAIDVNSNFNFFNPKLGFTYALNETNSFYASYAKANREPNRNDFEVGTTQHESLDDYELGWRLKNENIKLSTNVYYMNYKNQLVLTGALNDVGSPIRATSGKSYRLGLEVDADIRISDQFSMRPNVAISSNKNVDFNAPINGALINLGNTPISNSPDIIAGNAFVFQPLKNLQFSLLSKYVGEQYMGNLGGAIVNEPSVLYSEISTNNEKLKSYFTSDFNVVYELETTKIFKSIVFSALINNIFDTKYVDRGYYYTYDDTWSVAGETTTIDGAGYYPQATRNFLVGVTLKF
ncbi:TonB-dependent receptor [Polaribacter sp. SA4-12]|uniref:TonB-dependent receptor n=1 Tax=Polaribacter sp. SA4-12 TaxID=1312072 RepID=UPI000B3D0081|nr:TonB-dependent receptor [Polaribacter sp. SA4-12]ARV16057.1 TonB-dependent receptor [Polaribacter sp. SA4-12]